MVRERTAELTSLNDQLLREIDERCHVEARLREAKREAAVANLSKTKFLAAVSHDLLQPLNAARDRKSVVSGKSVYVRVDIGGRRIIKQNTLKTNYRHILI